jgi:pre-mRNA-processing factor 19
MLESFALKQHLDATRQELSQALYQHDAACRVIARLMRERDEARGLLSSLNARGVELQGSTPMEMDGEPQQQQSEPQQEEEGEGRLPGGVLGVLGDTCAALSKGRKGRKPGPEQATREQLAAGSLLPPALSVTPHASAKPGVTCLAMCGVEDEYVSLSGGNDKMGFLTELGGGRVLAKLSGHTKKVTAVALHSRASLPPVAFTASLDNSVRVWTPDSATSDGGYSQAACFPDQHAGEIHSLCAHPSGDFVLGVSADNSWSFVDVTRGASLLSVAGEGGAADSFSSGGLHPDGLILACGTSSGAVRLWDIREQQQVATLGGDGDGGHAKGVSCLCFNQNGYLLASGGLEGSCLVWDLRKLKQVASPALSSKKPVTAVAFDPSGSFLAVGSGSGSVDLSAAKEWGGVASLGAHKKSVTGLAWGRDASFLVSASLDRAIKKQIFK